MTAPAFVDALLSEAAIRNGHLDLESRYSDIFPSDSFGDRSGTRKGMSITLEFDGRSVETDIRIKSDATISPRTRFGAWYKALRAAPGDVIRVHRSGARRFRLDYLPSGRGTGSMTPPRAASVASAGSKAAPSEAKLSMPRESVAKATRLHSQGAISQGLLIADPWVDLILSGRKTWEIRGEPVSKRGPFAILRKGTGTIAGIATLVDSKGPLSLAELRSTNSLHAVPLDRFEGEYRYDTPFAWVLESPIRLARPVLYRHPNGAVKWVNLDEEARDALRQALEPREG